ncbi:MAG: hypothetical protein ACR2GX_05485 [Candidatus Dormibacteria bacterium]
MSPLVLAAAWGGAGVVATLGVRLLRVRRLGPLVGVGLAILSITGATVGATGGPLSGGDPALARVGLGLLAAGGVALAAAHLLQGVSDGFEPLILGVVGGTVVLILAARSPLLWGLAALVAMGTVSVRWLTLSPGRATLAAGRIPALGAAAILAAAPFLPVTGEGSGPGATLVGNLLLVGVIGLLALVPAGGWAVGSAAVVRSGEIAVWMFLIAPAVLITSATIPSDLVLGGRLTFEHGLLVAGLVSAMWGGVQASRRVGRGTAYTRVAVADLALFAAGIGSTQAVARSGGLLLVLTHLVVGPLLLQTPVAALARQRRLGWVALSGIPPSPAFWGRLLVLEGCAAASSQAGLTCLIALGFLFLAAVLALVRGEHAREGPDVGHPRQVLAWVIGVAGIALGLAPGAVGRVIFGGL